MADEKVDEDSAENGVEEENDAPKKTFGILAARFLQKGKSSPGSITGEFEALSLPNPTATPDSKVRNLHPIDDEDEDIREGSIHGMEVPLSESLYADIGLDDMSAFGDSDIDSASNNPGRTSGSYDSVAEVTPEIVYDIDATEQPVISFGSGVQFEHAFDLEMVGGEESEPAQFGDSAAEIDEQPVVQFEEKPVQYEQQEIEETQPVQLEEQTQIQTEAAPEYQYGAEEATVTSDEAETAYQPEIAYEPGIAYEPEIALEQEFAPEIAQEPEIAYESEAAPAPSYEPEVAAEYEASSEPEIEFEAEAPEETEVINQADHSYEIESANNPAILEDESTALEQAAAFDAAALDAIGIKAESEKAAFDKSVLDQIGSEKAVNDQIFVTNEQAPVPEKKGLLGKFATKKDPAVRPLIGGKKDAPPEPIGGKAPEVAASDPTVNKGFDASALDSIGTKAFDASALDSIGTKGFDASALDSIGTKGFDASALDSIGTKGFDASALDSIGTKGFDAGALDSIGTKGFDASALDSIGEPVAPPVDAKEKPAAKPGGLLGGKFGQKAKVLGSEKSKLGAIVPPSTDPSSDQKETGRFMVNAPESVDSMSANESLTVEATEDFSAPTTDFSVDETEAQPAKEALSASFFDDDAKDAYVEEEHIPVIGSDEIGRLITDADNAYRLKQFKAAEPIFANVLDRLDKIGDETDPLLPYCLDKMADNLFQLKKYNESLQFFRRLLVLHTKVSSPDREMISTLYKIAQTSEALSLTGEADSMYKRAFRLGQQSLVPGDPLLAKVLEGYGTMLMRSEGAEPPPAAAAQAEKSAEKPADASAAEKASALSAEEIAMLNSLGAASDRAASEASPIILASGPSDQAISKSRPLKETDERADKVRGTAGPGGAAGGVWVRLGVFISVVVGLVLVVLNVNTDYTAHHIGHSKNYPKRTYKSLDGVSTFTVVSEDQAAKDSFGKHFAYDYRDWKGTPSDDLEVISGQITGDNFVYEIPQGVKDSSGFVYFDPHAPELSVLTKMKELGKAAQDFYTAHGKYPDGKELEKLAKALSYKNPFGGAADSVTTNSIAWPSSIDANQVFIKSLTDMSMEDGGSWEGEAPAKPGQISAAATNHKQPDASLFYVHGRDRDGKLLTRADGKVFVLIYKNGIDSTPNAADLKNEKPGSAPSSMRLSKTDGSINNLTILLSYVPIVLFGILSIVALIMVNKQSETSSKGFSLATFGVIWSPILVLLTGLAKFVPAPFSTVCLVLALIVFFGGLGWCGFKMAKSAPKKSKKPPPEASAM